MSKLTKEIGLFELFSFASGSMISSGLFVLPAIAYKISGSGAVIAYFFAALLMLPSVLSQAELSTAMPKAGGTYFYVERILGSSAGIVVGLANWFSIASKSAFALIGIGAFATILKPDLSSYELKIIAAFFCIVFTIINLLSVKSSGKFQVVLVIFLLASLGIYIILGYPKAVHNPDAYKGFFDKGFFSLLETTGLVFISFGGLTKIASIAEEVKDAGKILPKAMFLAFFIISSIYVITVGITIGILTPEQLNNELNLTPLTQSAEVFMGKIGMIIMSVGAILAFITTANAGILSASRAPLAMSRDGHLPKFFGKIGKKFNTPYISIVFTSIFMLFIILFLEVKLLAKVASTFMILLFIMVNISLIVVRKSKIRNYRPSFKSPFFPWIQIIGIFFYALLIVKMGIVTLFVSFVFVIFAFLWYRFYAKKRDRSAPALIKLTGKILNEKLKTEKDQEVLEEELLDILKERENIIEDRFDTIIKKCKIIEVKEKMVKSEFFHFISQKLEDSLQMDSEGIYHKLCEREMMSNTNIGEHIAIPHLIVEGEKKFEILLVRNKNGIDWTENKKPVHAVFVLIGTMDERNFHLRALMAIAQIVQDSDFMKKWMTASDSEDLRSTILLASRKRDV